MSTGARRWEEVQPLNARHDYRSITGYCWSGPYRDRPGFDVTAYFGRSGILDAARYEGGPPGLSLPAQGDRATAMTLVAAILLGLRHRDQTGQGSWVGTSLYANGAWANGTTLAGAAIGATLRTRSPPDKPRNALTNLYRTKDDRWLQLLVVRDDRLWTTVCSAIGRPELANDARFTERDERKRRALELHAILAPVFASKTYAEWEQALARTGIPFGVIERVIDVVEDPQAEHAGIFAATTNPEVPRTVNNPIRLGFARPRTSGLPATVGQHNEDILRELGHSEAEIAALKESGALG
jgi:formyl-CoA transferase